MKGTWTQFALKQDILPQISDHFLFFSTQDQSQLVCLFIPACNLWSKLGVHMRQRHIGSVCVCVCVCVYSGVRTQGCA